MKSALYEGTLVHARRTPARHVFRYPVAYWLLDLDDSTTSTGASGCSR